MVDLILLEVEGCVVMVDCILLLMERLECCVVDVDGSAIGECTLLILVILTSLVELLCNVLRLHVK